MVRILIEFGGETVSQRGKKVQVSINGHLLSISTHLPISKKRVKALCQATGIGTVQFDELYRSTVPN